MIERLRRKFIMISMCSILIVLTVIVTFINVSSYFQINRQADQILSILAENNGKFPKSEKFNDDHRLMPNELSPEAPFSTRFFSVVLDSNSNILTVDTGKIAAASTKEATVYATEVLKTGKETGFVDVYKFAVISKEYETMIIFLDCRQELKTFHSFLEDSILISLLGLLSILILVLILSKKAIKPVVESYEKQKRFITDAGHELKTPLAIISANTEVLELSHGENEWVKSIYNQINRMTGLTENLVTLARMDEEHAKNQMTDFSISDAVIESAEPLAALAKLQEKEIRFDIVKNLSYYGNEQSIRQLVTILLDNSIKYSVDKAEILLSLKGQGKRVTLSTSNIAYHVEQDSLPLFFERFYRVDASRNSQTGGNGIGLSIAKAIVTQHKGKIKAESPDGKTIIITAQL